MQGDVQACLALIVRLQTKQMRKPETSDSNSYAFALTFAAGRFIILQNACGSTAVKLVSLVLTCSGQGLVRTSETHVLKSARAELPVVPAPRHGFHEGFAWCGGFLLGLVSEMWSPRPASAQCPWPLRPLPGPDLLGSPGWLVAPRPNK